MNKKIRTEAVDFLFDAILSLKNREECYTFFEDVCTINELLSLSQRFEVAKMLREQKTYLEIAEKTGASTATISRVNRSLNYGNDGYDMVFERLEEKEEESFDSGFKVGDKVLHNRFGEGVILNISDDGLVGKIKFDVGVKELMLNIASLEKVEENG